MKCVRHRCQAAPGSVAATASRKPECASEIASWTPRSPRATSPRRHVSQPAPASVVTTSTPKIARFPSAFTPTAINTATFTIRPSSRHRTIVASSHTYGYGPPSNGLVGRHGDDPVDAVFVRPDEVGEWCNADVEPAELRNFVAFGYEVHLLQHIEVDERPIEERPDFRLSHGDPPVAVSTTINWTAASATT